MEQQNTDGEDLSCLSYPLNELATQKDEIRADCQTSDYETSFKLHPAGEEVSFVFRSPEKNASRKVAAAWLDAINMAVTGTKSSAAMALRRSVPGVEMLAGALKDTFDVVKTTLPAQIQISGALPREKPSRQNALDAELHFRGGPV